MVKRVKCRIIDSDNPAPPITSRQNIEVAVVKRRSASENKTGTCKIVADTYLPPNQHIAPLPTYLNALV